jgi:hypothetical protein
MKIEIKNSQLEQKLERKKDFLTLEYISILDNAIRNIILGTGDEELKKLLKNKDGENQDIFGASNFITNFINNSDDKKRKFLEKLNSDLFIGVNSEKLDILSESNIDSEDNFYILYANIYCLRQEIVHKNKINQSSSNESSNQDSKNYNNAKRIKNLLDTIEKKSAISHYKYLMLALPISFSYHLKNLFWAINQKSENKENLNAIEGFIEFSKGHFNAFFKDKESSSDTSFNDNKSSFAKIKFIRNIPINRLQKNLKVANGSKMKFNFIGEKNYIDLQNLIKKINQNYPLKVSRNNDKKELDQKISFEEIERIYELIIEINVLFRINFTRFYNIEKHSLEERIRGLNNTRNDKIYKEVASIFEIIKNHNKPNFLKTLNTIEKKLKNPSDVKVKIKEIINKVNESINEESIIRSLRNEIDHSNFFGIFQTSKNKHFSIKNFQENLNNIEEFLQNFSNNSADKSDSKPDFSSFRNQLIQALSKKDYFLIKSQYQNDIKLHRVGLDHRKISSRKKSNKQKIKDVIQKHRQDRKDKKVKKYSKKSKKQKSEFRLLKFSNYAEFKTTLIKKGLKKIELNKVKI